MQWRSDDNHGAWDFRNSITAGFIFSMWVMKLKCWPFSIGKNLAFGIVLALHCPCVNGTMVSLSPWITNAWRLMETSAWKVKSQAGGKMSNFGSGFGYRLWLSEIVAI